MRRIAVLLLTVAAAIVFNGCPHEVQKQIEEALPPENYEPDYLKSTLSLSELQEKYRGAGAPVTVAQMHAIDSLKKSGIPPESWPEDLRTAQTTLALAALNSGDSTATVGIVPTIYDTLRAQGVPPSAWPVESRPDPLPLIKMDVRSVNDDRYPDEVELHASVYDAEGGFISGLAPPTFSGTGKWQDYWYRLIDSCGGQAVSVENFTVQEVSEENREPYSLAFVLDHSTSMGKRRVKILRKAVGLLLKGISKNDNVSIISFANGSLAEVPLTGSKKKWVTTFRPADLSTFGGGTRLYDAAVKGIEEVSRGPEDAKRVLVIFTDGGDGGSKAKLEQVHSEAKKKGVTLYTIAYGPADTDVLKNLAQFTGGRMYRIYKSQEFLSVFIDIYRRLNHFYRITYNPPDCAGIHTVRPSLRLPELSIAGLEGEGVYDRSVFTPFDSVGKIVFVNIGFEYNEAAIRPESRPLVQDVAEAMKRYPDMTMEIRGHTDDQGSDEYNLKLSKQRAQAVADLLVAQGISRRRLKVKGYGETRPLVPNDSDESRRKNRRTEFVILSR